MAWWNGSSGVAIFTQRKKKPVAALYCHDRKTSSFGLCPQKRLKFTKTLLIFTVSGNTHFFFFSVWGSDALEFFSSTWHFFYNVAAPLSSCRIYIMWDLVENNSMLYSLSFLHNIRHTFTNKNPIFFSDQNLHSFVNSLWSWKEKRFSLVKNIDFISFVRGF